MIEKVLVSWSGGKDSAHALYEFQRSADCEIVSLLTTVTEDYDRISIHGIRRSLLEQQAEALGIPLEVLFIAKDVTEEEYESRMGGMLIRYQEQGVTSVVFGDIFLEDLRRHREDGLKRIGMKGIFPLWKQHTRNLAKRFIDSGFQAIITCVDSHLLDRNFVGRTYNEQFLSDLPPHIDPCGENGEFHSFVLNGPIFREGIPCIKGEEILRENRFSFCDLLPFPEWGRRERMMR